MEFEIQFEAGTLPGSIKFYQHNPLSVYSGLAIQYLTSLPEHKQRYKQRYLPLPRTYLSFT